MEAPAESFEPVLSPDTPLALVSAHSDVAPQQPTSAPLNSSASYVSPFSSRSGTSSARPRLLPIVSAGDIVDPGSWPKRRHRTHEPDVEEFRAAIQGTTIESSASPIVEDNENLGEPHEPPVQVDPRELLRSSSVRNRVIRAQETRIFPSSDWYLNAMEERLIRWRPPLSQASIEEALNGDHPYQQSLKSRKGCEQPTRSLSTGDADVLGRYIRRLQQQREKTAVTAEPSKISNFEEFEPKHESGSIASTLSTEDLIREINNDLVPDTSNSFLVPLSRQHATDLTTQPPSSIFPERFPLSRTAQITTEGLILSDLHPVHAHEATPFNANTDLDQFRKAQDAETKTRSSCCLW